MNSERALIAQIRRAAERTKNPVIQTAIGDDCAVLRLPAANGKVAVAGYGHSPVDRRWDGTSMDQTVGAYSILACQKAMDDAGVTPEQIDQEMRSNIDLVLFVLKSLGLTDYRVRVGLRDPKSTKYVGSDDDWNNARFCSSA